MLGCYGVIIYYSFVEHNIVFTAEKITIIKSFEEFHFVRRRKLSTNYYS